jgi:hypothetical protein
LKPASELEADVAHENGIAGVVHQTGPVVSELSNEDCVVKQEDRSINENISHGVVENGDAVNGYHCELKKESPTAVIQPGQPLFLVKSWRTQLCRCPNCLRMYEERQLGFLLDSDDTLQVLPHTFFFYCCMVCSASIHFLQRQSVAIVFY